MFHLNFDQPCIGTDSYLLFILNDTGLELMVECNDTSSRQLEGREVFFRIHKCFRFLYRYCVLFLQNIILLGLCHELEALSPLMIYELKELLP